MRIDAPVHVERNAFVYDTDLYRCTMELAYDGEKPWRWEVALHMPAPPHAKGAIHVVSQASGRENTAEDALRRIEEKLSSIEHHEQKETFDKYAG